MDQQPRKQRPARRPAARPGSGGRLPEGEAGPDVVGTDAALVRVREQPEDIPGESPDHERSPSRGGWQF